MQILVSNELYMVAVSMTTLV
ncbi:rCG63245 [Rattus norvegicus]|uniref:RCG63245 n=1 Tax=Rattus norvegicus TaxID=10116 RepID=A6KB10_RAT|nr:rCG63245 [Rattus norvegicus]